MNVYRIHYVKFDDELEKFGIESKKLKNDSCVVVAPTITKAIKLSNINQYNISKIETLNKIINTEKVIIK